MISLTQEQGAYDSIVAGDDIDMPYAGRRALYLGQWTQPDHAAFTLVADRLGQLRSDHDIARVSNCGRERLIIDRHSRLAVENIERNHLRSRSADSLQTARHQRARPRKASQPRDTGLIYRNDGDLGRRSDLPPAAQQPVTSDQVQLRHSPGQTYTNQDGGENDRDQPHGAMRSFSPALFSSIAVLHLVS